jgi:hypothetical protein
MDKRLPPLWVRERISHWKHEFDLDKWFIIVRMRSRRAMEKRYGKHVKGCSETWYSYLQSSIYLISTIKNDSDGRELIFHEMRHVYYENQLRSLRQFEANLSPSKAKALGRVIADTIETLIEMDTTDFAARGLL